VKSWIKLVPTYEVVYAHVSRVNRGCFQWRAARQRTSCRRSPSPTTNYAHCASSRGLQSAQHLGGEISIQSKARNARNATGSSGLNATDVALTHRLFYPCVSAIVKAVCRLRLLLRPTLLAFITFISFATYFLACVAQVACVARNPDLGLNDVQNNTFLQK